MSTESASVVSSRATPARPSIEFVKNEAKRRLAAQRPSDPDLKLTAVQFDIAREYGYASWRALKAAWVKPSPLIPEAIGDWIGHLPSGLRVALHVRSAGAVMDSPDYGSFGFGVANFTAVAGCMSFELPRINAAFHSDWDKEDEAWRGCWRQDGLEHPLTFTRGSFPPAPVVDGLDGVWEGLLGHENLRLIFRVSSGRCGTHAMCDSPDRSGSNLPVAAIERAGDHVTFRMKTASFEGTVSEMGDCILGQFRRGETVLPLSLSRRLPGDPPLARPGIAMPEGDLHVFAGRYRLDDTGTELLVTMDGDALTACFSDGSEISLIPIATGEFQFKQGVGRVVFDVEPAGHATGLTFWSYNHRSSGRRAA